MRKSLLAAISALVLVALGLPARAQMPLVQMPLVQLPVGQPPLVQPLPDPTPLGIPSESPVPPQTTITSAAPTFLTGGHDSCNTCDKKGCWNFGGGAYFITPVFENNNAFTLAGTVGGVGIFSRQDFSHSMRAAPLAWLGYTCANGLGIRGRWWMFDDEGKASSTLDGATSVSSPFATVTPSAGSSAIATSDLSLHVYDLEATCQWSCGRWSFLGSLGGRIVQLRQGYLLNIVDATGAVTDSTGGSSTFNGAGPTVSFEAHYCLCNIGFSLYGLARGSMLFGTGQQGGSLTGTLGAFSVSSRQVDILPIGELEAGAEWGTNWGRYRFFAQAGFVGQAWFGGGSASQGPASSDLGQNFGFFGGVGRVGFSF